MDGSSDKAGTGLGVGEILAVVAVIAAFFAVNLATGARSPVVWSDEVFLADPAQNLASGHGFTSTMLPQPGNQFFAGNVPLHTFLLTGWFKIWGFGLLEARSFTYFLMAGAALMFWMGMARSGLIKNGTARVVAISVILLCCEVTFTYRSGRYDALAMLLYGIAFVGFSARTAAERVVTALSIGALLPMAGLQLLVYTTVLSALLWLFLGGRAARYCACLVAGMCAGVGILAAIYAANGVLGHFIDIVRHTSSAGQVQSIGELLHVKAAEIGQDAWNKPSWLPLLALLGWMILMQRREGRFRWRSPAVFGLTVGLAVPVILHLAYDFPIYYGYMCDIPMIICATAAVMEYRETAHWRMMWWATAACFTVIALAGLVLRTITTALEWHDRDYGLVESFVNENITPEDHAIIDHTAYYAVKPRAAACYGWYYLPVMSAQEKAGVTALVIEPIDLNKDVLIIGGRWKRVAEMPPPVEKPLFSSLLHSTDRSSYALSVYRRISGQ